MSGTLGCAELEATGRTVVQWLAEHDDSWDSVIDLAECLDLCKSDREHEWWWSGMRHGHSGATPEGGRECSFIVDCMRNGKLNEWAIQRLATHWEQ